MRAHEPAMERKESVFFLRTKSSKVALLVRELSWAALHSIIRNKTRGRNCRVHFPRLSDLVYTHWTLEQVYVQWANLSAFNLTVCFIERLHDERVQSNWCLRWSLEGCFTISWFHWLVVYKMIFSHNKKKMKSVDLSPQVKTKSK